MTVSDYFNTLPMITSFAILAYVAFVPRDKRNKTALLGMFIVQGVLVILATIT